jgi:hypothetical protein
VGSVLCISDRTNADPSRLAAALATALGQTNADPGCLAAAVITALGQANADPGCLAAAVITALGQTNADPGCLAAAVITASERGRLGRPYLCEPLEPANPECQQRRQAHRRQGPLHLIAPLHLTPIHGEALLLSFGASRFLRPSRSGSSLHSQGTLILALGL